MCGIAGLMARGDASWDAPIETMISTLRHRGPDDVGLWRDREAGVFLGHARLSILDLSPQGHQPMRSASGRYVITYNGEIYNFAELRSELEAQSNELRWRGHSDTEVLLAAVETWGLRQTLTRLVGMFAFALWDRQRRELWLARDRIGEKPLYYGSSARLFAFASELKAIRVVVEGEIDREAVAAMMRFGCIPAPRTIYREFRKLPPGCLVRVVGGVAQEPERYWSLDSEDHKRLADALASADDEELARQLDERLDRAVSQQMVADVPLGAFLSGGVDSSLIVAMMQARSRQPVRTFTIGFAEAGFDEAPFARDVARYLGTDHTELYVNANDALAVIPEIPRIYDEPFADPSQIPTALVSRLTRQRVTVSLSGDGGDELFGGYQRYLFAPRVWNRLGHVPSPGRAALARLLSAVSPQQWDRLLTLLPILRRHGASGHRLGRLAWLLTTRSFAEMYLRLVSQWQPEDGLVLGAGTGPVTASDWPIRESPLLGMRRWDLAQYLPDDILVKVDRASMNASLESRAPLLDHRVVEFALALPDAALIRNGESKWLLRRVLYKRVPKALIERPKSGFSLPLADWLRGPLRAWADSLLEPDKLVQQGMLDARKVRGTWADHVAGLADRSSQLWNVLMFQAWLEQQAVSSDNKKPGRSAPQDRVSEALPR